MRDPLVREYRTIQSIRGPLLFTKRPPNVAAGDMVTILVDAGDKRDGQVIELNEKHAVIQVFGMTDRISPDYTLVRFKEESVKINLSPLCLGRVYSGGGEPIDDMPTPAPSKRSDVYGSAINPVSRDIPEDFIQTGVSAIDGLNTLVRGQKLPIFSCSGLPANELATMIMANAGTEQDHENFSIVFAGMGITSREADYFRRSFVQSGAVEHAVLFINLADDPVIERLLTPRFALTMAEYLAFDLGRHVLVVLTDMTNYCNALREISSAREEIPGRRGYPGYLYTDLAGIYERAGRIKGKKGSITQLPILTMPDDDITHPAPDFTGYITEGQIVLDRGLNRKGIFPPIEVLPSLSRLMDQGIGEGRTREDHRQVADQLYMLYARGVEQRRIASIIGEEGLTDMDRKYLEFADTFENEYLNQGTESRSITETLRISWKLMGDFSDPELIRLDKEYIAKYKPERQDNEPSGD